jgi:predicted nucleotidyltransferase
MNSPATGQPWSDGLPTHIKLALEELITAAQKSFGANLRSLVMFGSGAEGRLRATSDVNLLIILKQFEQAQADLFRDPLRVAHAAAQVSAMFVLETELAAASEAFAVKFSDIARRHRVLCGENLLGQLETSRAAKIQRLKQVVLNTLLRLRERYVLVSLREQQLALTIADMAGPLRAAAATLLELEGKPAASSREALQIIAQEHGKPDWQAALELVSQARESRSLPAGKAAEVMFALMELCSHLRQRLNQLA